tara:strand:+ start:168 stop:698 length:531 start_codon:yes stop_codon:yes gene_type:complete
MKPWEDPRTPWKTKSAFMSYIRGCLRIGWNKHPVKLAVLKNQRKQVPNPNPRGNKKTVWGFECPLCGTEDVIKNAQVDHIKSAGTLREISDIQQFAENLLVVVEEDLRLICKNCNSALAMSDKQGISFEEARATKKAIAIQKEKRDTEFLESAGISPARNAKERRQQIIDYLLKQE